MALDDRAHQGVHDGLEAHLRPLELLGDQGEGGPRGLADAEGEVPGLPPHGDHEVPPRRGLGVHHEVLHDVHPDVAGGLEAEGVHVGRQVEVVVDRLGDVHDLHAASRLLLEPHGRVGGVVAPDGDELGHVQAQEGDHRVLEVLGVLGGVGPGDPDVGAPAEVDAAHLLDGQGGDPVHVAVHDPLEAVADPEHLHPFEHAADGGGADHAVDPGGGPSAHEDGESLLMAHDRTSNPFVIRRRTRGPVPLSSPV